MRARGNHRIGQNKHMKSAEGSIALENIFQDSQQLIAAIAQDATSGEILMLAWMNREALELTIKTHQGTYWSRSRNEMWVKGATSGNTQHVRSISLDCDGDAIVLKVDQIGVACHTGSPTCFYRDIELVKK